MLGWGMKPSPSLARVWLKCFGMATALLSSPPANPVSLGFRKRRVGGGEVLGAQPDWSHSLFPAVARRCFPAIHAHKGVLMVGNETTYEDGHGSRKNITELVEGAK